MSWEQHLDPESLKLLETYRQHAKQKYGDDYVPFFARQMSQNTTHSPDFHRAVAAAQSDPREEAKARAAAEISSYPFRLELPDSPFYDV